MAHEDYTVAWICALPLEAAAAKAILDKTHPQLPQSTGDDNAYMLGEISGHSIIIACLPSGVYGTISAATVAANMRTTFPCIRFGLMVGIGGGVPSIKNDIRLGDVVVSKPT
ncbi:kinesin [Elaphomyces granulatus]